MTRRSFGNVRQTASGRWHCRYTAPDGAPRSIGKTFRTKREAESALNTIGYEMERGIWIDPKAPKPEEPSPTPIPTLSEYGETFLAQQRGKKRNSNRAQPSTRELNRTLFDLYLAPTFASTQLDGITRSAVKDWLVALEDPMQYPHRWKRDADGRPEPMSGSRIRQCYSLLRAILNEALRDEVIDRNPCTIRGAGSDAHNEPEYMSQHDARKIIGHLRGDSAVLAKLALATGCRLGELLALTWNDVLLDAQLLVVRSSALEVSGAQVLGSTKTGDARRVPVEALTISMLREFATTREHEPTHRLFLSASGTPLRHRQVQAAWRRARDAAGLTFRFHDLRHTALTRLAYEGKPLQEIMRQAGHRSVRAALNYQRQAPDAQRIEGDTAA